MLADYFNQLFMMLCVYTAYCFGIDRGYSVHGRDSSRVECIQSTGIPRAQRSEALWPDIRSVEGYVALSKGTYLRPMGYRGTYLRPMGYRGT
jgi:hypothetical protein